MGHSHGLRSGTRYAFSRNFKEHGSIPLSTYLKTYRVGDIVDIKVNGAVQKGKKIAETLRIVCPTRSTTERPVSSTT
ncbi:hypothetical protein MW887_002771 [Aspergillus wentii]|nr:hypothetical protein MW887_002771 [Aspergillus wentii]